MKCNSSNEKLIQLRYLNKVMMNKLFLIILIFITSHAFGQNSEENCFSSRKKYLEQNSDVAKAGVDPWNHYLTFGKKEGRKWPICDEIKMTQSAHDESTCSIAKNKYLEQNPDVAKNGADAWLHYTLYGNKEGRIWPICTINTSSINTTLQNKEPAIIDNNLNKEKKSDNKSCIVNPNSIWPSGIKYEGECLNNKAEGFGKLYFNSGNYIKGIFRNNSLDENYPIELYEIKNNRLYIGHTKNFKLHGAVTSFDGVYISNQTYKDGVSLCSGDCDYIIYPAPIMENVNKFLLHEQYLKSHYFFHKIQNSNKYFASSMTELYIYDMTTNKLTKHIHNLNASLNFKGMSSDDNTIYVTADFGQNTASGWVSKKILKYAINIKLKTNQPINEFPESLTSTADFIFSEKYKAVDRNGFNTEKRAMVSRDKKYVYFIPSSLHSRFSELGRLPSDTLLKLDINGSVIAQKIFTNSKVESFILDESNGRILVSIEDNNGSVSRKLSAFDMNNFNFISDIITNCGQITNLQLSKSAEYIIAETGRGTLLFKNDKLVYFFNENFIGMNNDEKVFISRKSVSQGEKIIAYDLDTRLKLWEKYLEGNPYYNFYIFNNDTLFISQENSVNNKFSTFKYFKIPVNNKYLGSWAFKPSEKETIIANNSSPSNIKPVNSSSTTSSASVCNFKFAMPTVNWKFIDNRKLCIYCKKRYAEHRKNNIEDYKKHNIVRMIQDKLEKHWHAVDASEEHKQKDKRRFLEFQEKNNLLGMTTSVFASVAQSYLNKLLKAMGDESSADEYLNEIKLYSIDSDFCSPKCQAEYRRYKNGY